MTPKFDRLCDRLRANMVSEMSLSVRPIKVDPFKYIKIWETSKHRCKNSERVKIFGTELNVHLIQSNDHVMFFIFREDELAFYIEGFLEDGGGIRIEMCVKVYTSGVPMDSVYKEFLLDEFSYILSDSLQTRKGFGVYVMLTIDIDMNVSVIDETTGEVVHDNVSHEEILRYHGSDPEQINYVFKVTKK